MMYKVEIPMKLPSCNNYIDACRTNRFKGAKMKADAEDEIIEYLHDLPEFDKPVAIKFDWQESNKKRDLDGICFAKKFILDALVKAGKLPNDNYRWVRGFIDTFSYGTETKVSIEIAEVEE